MLEPRATYDCMDAGGTNPGMDEVERSIRAGHRIRRCGVIILIDDLYSLKYQMNADERH